MGRLGGGGTCCVCYNRDKASRPACCVCCVEPTLATPRHARMLACGACCNVQQCLRCVVYNASTASRLAWPARRVRAGKQHRLAQCVPCLCRNIQCVHSVPAQHVGFRGPRPVRSSSCATLAFDSSLAFRLSSTQSLRSSTAIAHIACDPTQRRRSVVPVERTGCAASCPSWWDSHLLRLQL